MNYVRTSIQPLPLIGIGGILLMVLTYSSPGAAGEWRSNIYCPGRFAPHCICSDGSQAQGVERRGSSYYAVCITQPKTSDVPLFRDDQRSSHKEEDGVLDGLKRLWKGAGERITKPLTGDQTLSSAVKSEATLNAIPPPGFFDPFDANALKEKADAVAAAKELAKQPGYNPFSGKVEPQWEMYKDLGQRQQSLQPPARYTDPFVGKELPVPGQLGKAPRGSCTFDSPTCR